jgi:T5SS/PEP-CTERM-associated repeat protein
MKTQRSQPLLGRAVLTGIGCFLFLTASARAQFTASYQTNIISGVTTNWWGSYIVGSNTICDQLQIVNAGKLSYCLSYVGYGANASNNSVVVSGSGSVWGNFDLFIGRYGSFNTLTISNGGAVYSSSSNVGLGDAWSSSSNTALVTGSGSVWSSSNVLWVGYYGPFNTLVISNGGVVYNSGSGVLGEGDNSGWNTVLVTGSGSVWSNMGSLYVGDWSAFNTLKVVDGGAVYTAGDAYLDRHFCGCNTALVDGGGSVWSNNGSLYIGRPGFWNTLTISNGGVVCNAYGFVGYNSDSCGNTVRVSGAGSIWNNRSDLYIGYWGAISNALTVASGGSVQASNIFIGDGCPNQLVLASGTVAACSLAVGGGGLTIWGYYQSCSSLSGCGTVSASVINNGTISADSSGATLTFTKSVLNNGTLTASGGGILDFYGPVLSLGTANFAGGQAIFRSVFLTPYSGTNSWMYTGDGDWADSNHWSLAQAPSDSQSAVYLTNAASKTVTVNAATLAASPRSVTNFSVTVAAPGGSTNTLKVDNTGMGVPFTAVNLNVGSGGMIELTNAALTVGMMGTGSFVVDGEVRVASGMVVSGSATNFTVGQGGTGTLTLSGGSLQAGRVSLGGTGSSRGALVLSAAQATLTNDLRVGETGSGNRLVISGGTVLSDYFGYLGYNYGSSSNSVLITGLGSVWSNRYSLYVGEYGAFNTLTISNGGAVYAGTNVYLGYNSSSSNNTVLVSGTGSVWSNGYSLYVGFSGKGNSLIISDGGAVCARANVYLGYNSSSSNNTMLVSGTGSVWSNPYSLYVGNYGAFNALTISNGGVVVASTLVVNPTNSLKLDAGTVIAANGLAISNNAVLQGSGVLQGNTILAGTVSPGNSAGIITNAGSLTVQPSAVLNFDLGTNNDLVVVTGNLTLGGTLNVGDAGGFTNGAYTLLTYGGTLTYNGVVIGSVPSSSYTYTISTNTAGQINLVVTPVLTPFQQWQTQYFGCTNCPQAAATADPDGDGQNNLAEFLAGTDPTNSASVLRIVDVTQEGDDVRITWTTVGGRTNAAQATAGDADGGYTTNFIDISGLIILPGSGDATTNYVDVGGATNAPARYYRIRLVP